MTGDPIDRHQNQSQIFEETNTSTNQQHNVTDIEAYFDNDSEGSAVGVAAMEFTYDTNDEVYPTI